MVHLGSHLLAKYGQLVKARRLQLGLSQSDAATRASISVGTWSLLERGVHRPKAHTASQIEKALQWKQGSLSQILAQTRDDQSVLEEFGQKVRARREELGLTRQAAARLAGISTSGWQHIERGKTRPRMHTGERLLDVLMWPTDALDQLWAVALPPPSPPGTDSENAKALRALGNRIRSARKDLGLTQRRAADLAGISPATWSPLEQGKIRPSKKTARRVGKLLGIAFQEFELLFETPAARSKHSEHATTPPDSSSDRFAPPVADFQPRRLALNIPA